MPQSAPSASKSHQAALPPDDTGSPPELEPEELDDELDEELEELDDEPGSLLVRTTNPLSVPLSIAPDTETVKLLSLTEVISRSGMYTAS